jgi:hypothetical protein
VGSRDYLPNLISLGVNIKFKLKEEKVTFHLFLIFLNGLFTVFPGFTAAGNPKLGIPNEETGFSV